MNYEATPPLPTPTHAPLGDDPLDRKPIGGIVDVFEAALRTPRQLLFALQQGRAGQVIGALLVIVLLAAGVYGAVVGTFSMGDQLWRAPLKIAGGLLVSALICVPSFYIFACLGGAQVRFWHAMGLVAGLVAVTAILLIGFAPVAWVFSQSTESIVGIGLLHLAFLAVAIGFGMRFLRLGFRHLCRGASEAGLNLWSIVFLLVVLQMSAALRPIIGSADALLPTEKKFFVTHWFDQMELQK